MSRRTEIMTQAANATDDMLLDMIDNATDADELMILECELDFRTDRPRQYTEAEQTELAEIEAAARTADRRRRQERAARSRQARIASRPIGR